MIEIYARMVDMGQEAEVPGKSAHDRMRYLLELVDKHGLQIVAKQARPTDEKPGGHL